MEAKAPFEEKYHNTPVARTIPATSQIKIARFIIKNLVIYF
jgi:hypothetical protein